MLVLAISAILVINGFNVLNSVAASGSVEIINCPTVSTYVSEVISSLNQASVAGSSASKTVKTLLSIGVEITSSIWMVGKFSCIKFLIQSLTPTNLSLTSTVSFPVDSIFE